MPEKKRSLANDSQHIQATSKRWRTKILRNRDPTSSDFKEEWTTEACFLCQYYVKLTGDLGGDWGVCSNPASPFDSRLMNEHDSCDYFSFAADEEEF